MATLDRINRRSEKIRGWRRGVTANESRQQRIKRLRRWNRLDVHYPDRLVPKPDGHAPSFKLVEQMNYRGVELFVTSSDRKLPKWTDGDHEDGLGIGQLLPFEQWETIVQYNGYCRFKSKPVIEKGYNGLLTYVPVHGGITFAQHKFGVSTYGFDTAHADDENNPLVKNIEWVGHQAAIMAMSIRVAAQFEPDYLRFKEMGTKALVIDRYLSKLKRLMGAQLNIQNNFGAMINLLSGKL